MKTVLASLAAVAAMTAFAAPAAAQPYDYGRYHDYGRYDGRHYDHGRYGDWRLVERRLRHVERQIAIGVRRGELTRHEAARLDAEARWIAQLEHRYRMNGLSRRELADLDRRLDRLEARVRYDRRDHDYGYGYGYGYGYRR